MVRAFRGRSLRQSLWLTGAALALAGGSAELGARQTGGGPSSGVYQLVARHSGKCLAVSGSSLDDAAPVIQWTCHGGDNQRWRVEAAVDGSYRLTATHSGKSLDVDGAATGDAATVIQYAPHAGDNQKWTIEAVGAGYYRLLARHSGKALDVPAMSMENGAGVIQYAPNGGANQQWLLTRVSEPAAGEPNTADIVRFLEQATFGPTSELIAHVRTIGLEAFVEEQFQAPASSYPTLPLFPTTRDQAACPDESTCVRDNYTMYPLQNRFFINALYGEDQLRQRVAFALHQIIVVSGVEVRQPSWMAPYLQTLDRNAFGNYRQLLYEISLNPAMGNYLDINNNNRIRPNENYAREILQLFSIGTVRLNLDGTSQLDENGVAIPTYTQETVDAFARVFTGWRFATAPAPGAANYIDPMVANQSAHDVAAKMLLNGVTLPPDQSAVQDLNDAIDNIFNHPNVGPFISKQLIQHLVTSNPSPGYVARVASVFNGFGGAGRGDLKAVVRAILLDPEARGAVKEDNTYGRLRHPAHFIAGILRAFGARSADGSGPSDGYLNPQSSAMGMDVFRPASVFSYFPPSTVVPGTAGVRGPEFGILTTSTALRRINFVNTMAFSRINVSANAPAGTALDFTPLLPQAANPAALVETLNTLLLHGTMPVEMSNSITAAVAAVTPSNPLKRVRTAVYLILTSSQYQVER